MTTQDDVTEQYDAWFSEIADAIEEFAKQYNLPIEKYVQDSPGWFICFNHPKGGDCYISVSIPLGDSLLDQVVLKSIKKVQVDSCWCQDDYDTFTRHLHSRKTLLIDKCSDLIKNHLSIELQELLATKLGSWTTVKSGYDSIWGTLTKEQFESIKPDYPIPQL